jgi:hypothetical protein
LSGQFSDTLILKYWWYFTISVYLKTGLIRGVASLEGDNLVVFYYLSVSENWPDKRDGFSGGGHQRGHPSYQARFQIH